MTRRSLAALARVGRVSRRLAAGTGTSDQKVEQAPTEILNGVHQPLPAALQGRRRRRVGHLWLLGVLLRHDQGKQGKL
jgi:hypothetical protein